MKNIKFLFVFSFVLLLANSAFALQCKEGTYAAGDECWTDVKIGISETTPVIPGVVLKYDINSNDVETAAYIVRVANASADFGRIAGVAQNRIATGDYGRILVRGKGKVRKALGAVVSGDYLFAALATGDAAVGPVRATNAQPTAFSLQTGTEAIATIDGFVIL